MVGIPLYLAVAQWALLAALGVLVVVLFRQLGRVLNGASAPGDLGPPIGSAAAPLTYVRPGRQVVERLTPGAGEPLLLAFVDPTCPSCEELVRTLGAMRGAGELAQARVLLLISDPASYLQISEAFSVTELEIGRPADPAGLATYRVYGTPLLVAVDRAGTVVATGSAVRPQDVRRYVEQAVRGTSSQHRAAAAEPAVSRGGDM